MPLWIEIVIAVELLLLFLVGAAIYSRLADVMAALDGIYEESRSAARLLEWK